MYFEALNNVHMAFKALTPLLDPVSGQIESPLAMLRDRGKERAKK
jgi:hypothetical protein